MWPVLCQWGPVTLHTYGALVALGFFLGYFYTLRLGRRHGVSADAVTDLAWWTLLAGLLGARLLYASFNPSQFLEDPLEIFKIWQGGLVWYGGFLAALAATVHWARRHDVPFLKLGDMIAPGLALGHGVGRLGCFAAGCCFGRPTDLPWAITFTHPDTLAVPNVAVHPSQLYEAVLNVELFVVLSVLANRLPGWIGSGRLTALYLAGYGVIRVLVEATRGDDRGPVWAGVTVTQWIAAACFAAGVALLMRRRPASS
jgi:phosphatidylglycerol---prolipoprotein diacylglyceryl transferase